MFSHPRTRLATATLAVLLVVLTAVPASASHTYTNFSAGGTTCNNVFISNGYGVGGVPYGQVSKAYCGLELQAHLVTNYTGNYSGWAYNTAITQRPAGEHPYYSRGRARNGGITTGWVKVDA